MKKLLVVCLVVALVGCAGVKLTPEMQRITSVTDTAKCQFIQNMVITTQPHNMMRYLQYNTATTGGDSYKIIATTPQSLMARNDVVQTSFEIYKCR